MQLSNHSAELLSTLEPVKIAGFARHLIGNAHLTPNAIAVSLKETRFRIDIGNNFASLPNFKNGTVSEFWDAASINNTDGLNLPMIPYDCLPHAIASLLSFPAVESRYFRCDKYLFISTANSYTGLHTDSAPNFFVQLHGKKRFVLADPTETSKMYLSAKYERGSRFSAADGRPHVDRNSFPQLADVKFREVLLSPGDALFVPKLWWHCVETLSPSISIATFCMSKIGFCKSRILEGGLEFLHKIGLYGRNCNCCENPHAHKNTI